METPKTQRKAIDITTTTKPMAGRVESWLWFICTSPMIAGASLEAVGVTGYRHEPRLKEPTKG